MPHKSFETLFLSVHHFFFNGDSNTIAKFNGIIRFSSSSQANDPILKADTLPDNFKLVKLQVVYIWERLSWSETGPLFGLLRLASDNLPEPNAAYHMIWSGYGPSYPTKSGCGYWVSGTGPTAFMPFYLKLMVAIAAAAALMVVAAAAEERQFLEAAQPLEFTNQKWWSAQLKLVRSTRTQTEINRFTGSTWSRKEAARLQTFPAFSVINHSGLWRT